MSFARVPSPSADRARTILGSEARSKQSDRRKYQRFPIIARAEYILAGNRTEATAQDISSGGVFLKTQENLLPGKSIRVLIDWPGLLDQRCPLRLLIVGKVLRSNEAGTAVKIVRYDFCIRSQNTHPVAA